MLTSEIEIAADELTATLEQFSLVTPHLTAESPLATATLLSFEQRFNMRKPALENNATPSNESRIKDIGDKAMKFIKTLLDKMTNALGEFREWVVKKFRAISTGLKKLAAGFKETEEVKDPEKLEAAIRQYAADFSFNTSGKFGFVNPARNFSALDKNVRAVVQFSKLAKSYVAEEMKSLSAEMPVNDIGQRVVREAIHLDGLVISADGSTTSATFTESPRSVRFGDKSPEKNAGEPPVREWLRYFEDTETVEKDLSVIVDVVNKQTDDLVAATDAAKQFIGQIREEALRLERKKSQSENIDDFFEFSSNLNLLVSLYRRTALRGLDHVGRSFFMGVRSFMAVCRAALA